MHMNEYEKEHASFVRSHGADCTVLLRSDGSFPLNKPCQIAHVKIPHDAGHVAAQAVILRAERSHVSAKSAGWHRRDDSFIHSRGIQCCYAAA